MCHPTACTAAAHPHQVRPTHMQRPHPLCPNFMPFILSDVDQLLGITCTCLQNCVCVCMFVCHCALTEVAMCVFLYLIRWSCRVKKVESRRCRLNLIMALQLSMVVSHHAPLDSPLSQHHPHPVAGKIVKRFYLILIFLIFQFSKF